MNDDPIGCPIHTFAVREGVGTTTLRNLIADGRIKAFRIGPKKLMIDVASYREYVAKQQREGLSGFEGTRAAVEGRKAKIAERKRQTVAEREAEKLAVAEAVLKDAGL